MQTLQYSSKIVKYLITTILFFSHTAFANDLYPKEERKTCVITCASCELGTATAKLLADDYDLILMGRNVTKLKQLQEELKKTHPGEYEICVLDFHSIASRNSFKDYLTRDNLSISGMVLIIPRPQFQGKSLIQDEIAWLEIMKTTFTGPMEILKYTIPHLADYSKIVVVAGTKSVQSQPDYDISSIIPRMWATYTKALSQYLKTKGTASINMLSPGVATTLNEKTEGTKPQEVAQKIKLLLTQK